MKPFSIRPTRPDDAQALNDHIRRIAEEPNNMISFSRGEYQRTAEEERKRIVHALDSPNSHMIVAVAQNEIIGMCRCFGSTGVERYTTGLAILVHREWRDQGVGTALMKDMIAWARDNPVVHRVEFTVYTHNQRAVHLYRKLGFHEEGIRKEAYFKDGRFVDAYLMAMLFHETS